MAFKDRRVPSRGYILAKLQFCGFPLLKQAAAFCNLWLGLRLVLLKNRRHYNSLRYSVLLEGLICGISGLAADA